MILHTDDIERRHVLVASIDGDGLQGTYLLHDVAMLVEVDDTIQLHIVSAVLEYTLLNDNLLVGDAVLYASDIYERIEEHEGEDAHHDTEKIPERHAINATQQSTTYQQQDQRQLIDDPLQEMWLYDDGAEWRVCRLTYAVVVFFHILSAMITLAFLFLTVFFLFVRRIDLHINTISAVNG